MKNFLRINLISMIFILMVDYGGVYGVDRWVEYGSTLKESENELSVETNGFEQGEGVVKTYHKILGGGEYHLNVLVRGGGVVYLKVQEFDSKGKVLRNKETDVITLNQEWRGGKIKLKTHKKTKGLHVFMLTKNKSKEIFRIKISKTLERP